MAKKSTAPAVPAITLAMIVAATVASADGFMYTPATVHKPLVDGGLVEVNPAMVDAAGSLATRATQKGIETVNGAPAAAPAATAAPAAAPAFKLETGIAMPAVTGRGRKASVYPFDEMQPGQSFFVPNTAERENAAKALATTVSAATARYLVPAVPPATKQVVNNVYAKGADGKLSRDAEGKLIKVGEKVDIVPVMVETRKFVIRSVTENGVSGARIWRTV